MEKKSDTDRGNDPELQQSRSFLPRALEAWHKAVHEQYIGGNHKKAFHFYEVAVGYFMEALEYTQSEKQKLAIRAKVIECLERAEQLHEIINTGDGASSSPLQN